MRNATPSWHRLPARRVGDLACVGLALLVAAPMLTARADDRADALLKEASAATARLQSLRANVQITTGPHTAIGTVEMKRPNLARVDLKGGNVQTIVADGSKVYTYAPARNEYVAQPDTPDGKALYLPWGIDLSFFHPEAIAAHPPSTVITYAGREKVGSEEYDVIQRVTSQPYSLTTRYLISPKDHLIRRTVMTVKDGRGQSMTSTMQITNLQVNAPLDVAAFRWAPPANAKPYQPPARGAAGPQGTGAAGLQPAGGGAPRR